MDPAERAKRVAVSLKINLKLADKHAFVERFAQNISRTGIFIRAKEPLPLGSRVNFEYRLADDARLMRGVGIVRWARGPAEANEAQPPGMGIEFTDLDPATDALIGEIVAKHGEGNRAPKREMHRLDAHDGSPSIDLSEDLSEELADSRPAVPPAPPAPAEFAPVAPEPAAAAPLAAPIVSEVVPKPPEKVEAEPDHEADEALAGLGGFDEPATPLPQTPLASPAAPTLAAGSTPTLGPVVIDLASDSCRVRRPGPVREPTALPWRVNADGSALDPDGLAVPVPLRLYDLASAARAVLLRHAGVDLVDPTAAEPRLRLGAIELPAASLLDLALALAHSDAAGGPCEIVVPTGTAEAGRAALSAACARAGLGAPVVKESALVLAGSTPRPVLVIELGRVGASAALVDTTGIRSHDLAVDAGWFDVEHALAHGARYRLLKAHGIDVDDDAELAASFDAQVRTGKDTLGSAPLRLSVAGAELEIDSDAVAEILRTQSERILLLAERVLLRAALQPRDLSSMLVYTEAPLWPGLLSALGAWAPSPTTTVLGLGDGARLGDIGEGEHT